jgi:hypothetical protein
MPLRTVGHLVKAMVLGLCLQSGDAEWNLVEFAVLVGGDRRNL